MADLVELQDAIRTLIKEGDTVAMEGFSHLIPVAAGQEVIRAKIRNLTLVRLTPDLIYDQMIGAGCARKLVFSWGGNPGVGSLHRFRDAIESGWPNPLEIEEHSHAALTNRYVAGASGMPFAVLKAYKGNSLPEVTKNIAQIRCPFTGEMVAAVPAINPDVTVIHAQQSDRKGNIIAWGITGIQKEAALAAKSVLVTVEEVVDEIVPRPYAITLPHWAVTAVSLVPGGARPSYASGYYERDNQFHHQWDAISKNRETFSAWIAENIMKGSDV